MSTEAGADRRDFDTAIIGGGITGMCLAWFLSESGASVICIDHGRNAGTTANAGSMHVQMQSRLVQLYPERIEHYEQTLSLYPLAAEFWQTIAGRLDEDIELRITGGLMVAEDERQLQLLIAKCERENRQGVATSVLDSHELQDIAPYLNDTLRGASFCEQEGKLNPLLANRAIERRALAEGAAIVRRTEVLAVERHATGFDIRTGAGRYAARRLVVAAGAGSGELAAMLGHGLRTCAEPLHMNITEAALPIIPHLVQHASRPITLKQLHSGHVVIGGGWPAAGGEPPQVLRDSVTGNLELAGHIVPQVGGLRLLRTWAGINPVVDLLSVLGEVTSVPGLFIAVPGDAGYTLGPFCARMLADELLGRPQTYPLTAFSPMRF